MTNKVLGIAAVVVLAAAMLCTAMAQQQPGKAPEKIPNAAEAQQPQLLPAFGRYQAMAIEGGYILVIDTQTGRCWTRVATVANATWRDLGSPVKE